MNFSSAELLKLAAIHRQSPVVAQRPQQSELIEGFVRDESMPSVELVKRKRWRRAELARDRSKWAKSAA